MINFGMCSYLGCLEREHQQLQQRLQLNLQQQSSATAAEVHQEMDVDTDHQQNGTPLDLGARGDCNNQTMQTFSTQTNQQQNKVVDTCTTCGICWRSQQHTVGCDECGGFALTRPCPICNGKCQALWNREVDMSNEMKSAFWDGACRLSQAEQEAHMLHNFVSNDVDTLVDALNDLGRSS